jgi:hypothetical protein
VKKVFYYTTLVILSIIIIIQFIPFSLPVTSYDKPLEGIDLGTSNPELSQVLKNSCFDCHSNQTHYPWYSHVAPVSWLVGHDVVEGREKLNFSEWNSYNKRKKIRKLEDIKEQVEKQEMPMPVYTFIHRNAKLNLEQIKLINTWASQLSEDIMGN